MSPPETETASELGSPAGSNEQQNSRFENSISPSVLISTET